MKRISMDKLTQFGVAFMTKRGVPENHARSVSQIIVETEAFRQSTHGLVQFGAIHAALGADLIASIHALALDVDA